MARNWFYWLFIASVWGCVGSLAAVDGAQPPVAPLAELPVPLFRRVFVPVDRLEGLIDGHVPIALADLQKMAAAWQAESQPARMDRITRGIYTARFADGCLQDGTAKLTWTNRPANNLVNLQQPKLALGVTSSDTEVKLGIDDTAQTILHHPVAGTIELAWSLNGHNSEQLPAEFQFTPLPSPYNELHLELPLDFTLYSSRGTVFREAVTDDGQRARWLVALGGHPTARLTIGPGSINRNQWLLARQQRTTYRWASQGVAIESTLELAGSADDHVVQLHVPRTVQLDRVLVGNTEAVWQRWEDQDDEADFERIELQLPAATGGHCQLQLLATAEVTTDRVCEVPQLHAVNMICQRREIELLVPSHLELGVVDVDQWRWLAQQRDPAGGRRLQLQALSEQARLNVICTRQSTQVFGNATTNVVVDMEGMTATVVAELQGQTGFVYDLAGQLTSGFAVESVSCDPPAALDDWTIDGPSGQRWLRFNLAQPLANGRRLTLTCVARRMRPDVGAAFAADLTIPLIWHGVKLNSDVRTFRALAPLRLEVEDDDFVVPFPTSADYAYTVSHRGRAPQLRLMRGQPQWQAMVDGEMRIGRRVCDERWRIEGQMSAGTLDSIVVQLTPAIREDVRWSFEGSNQPEATAVKLDSAEKLAANIAETDDAYRIQVPGSRQQKFVLRGERRRELGQLADDLPLSIAMLPGAVSRGAILRIGVDQQLTNQFYIDSPLTSVAATPNQPRTPLLAALSYDCSGEVKPPLLRRQRVSESSISTGPGAWIAKATTETRYAASGQRAHRTEMRVEHTSTDRLEFQLPPGSQLQRMEVNGSAVPATPDQPTINIPLDLATSSTAVVVEYSQPATHWWLVGTLQPPQWKVSVPVAQSTWLAMVPRRWGRASHPDKSWRHRLWGRWFEGIETDRRPAELVLPAGQAQRNNAVLHIYDWPAFTATAWVILPLLAAVVWSGWIPLPYIGYLLSFTLAATLLAPDPASLLAAAAWWGTLFGCGLQLLPPTKLELPRRPLRPATMGALVFGCCGLYGPMLAGQIRPTIPVIIPFDESNGSLSGFAYLRKSDYGQIVRTYERQQRSSYRWLLRDVHYDVELAAAANELVESQAVHARYVIETTQPDTRVTLPVGRDARQSWTGVARLDAAPVECRWTETGTAVAFQLDQPGVHQLQLDFRPTPVRQDPVGRLEFPIAPHPSATLQVISATDRPQQVAIESALGAVQESADGSQTRAQLGPVDRLSVRWQQPAPSTQRALQQWMQLTVFPENMNCIVRVTDPTTGRSPERLSLRLDKRAVVLSGRSTTLTSRRGSMLDISWPEQTSDRYVEVVVPISRVGDQLTAPLPELANVETVSRWALLQTDGSLRLDREQPGPAATVAVPMIQPPESMLIRQLPVGQKNLTLMARERANRWLGEEQLEILFDDTQTEVDYRADMTAVEGATFQLELGIPADLQVVTAQIQQAGTSIPIAWTRVTDNALRLLPARPVAGSYQLQVQGHLPMQHRQPAVLPLVQLANAKVTRSHVRITRSSSVGVQLDQLQGLGPSAELATGFRDTSHPQLVANLEVTDRKNATARITTWPNAPNLKGDVVTKVHVLEGIWSFETDVIVSSADGFVDSIVFELPQSIGAELEVQPSAPWEIIPLLANRRRLRIQRPIESGELARLRITGRLDTTNGIIAPKLQPLFFDEVRSWMLLPNAASQNQLTWLTRRMVPQSMPDHLSDDDLAGYTSYRAIGRQSTAQVQPSAGESAATIELLVQEVLLNSPIVFQKLKYFVQPAGQSQLTLQLPSATKLIHAKAAGRQCDFVRIDASAVQLTGLPTKLPFIIELVCQSPLRGRRELQVDWPRPVHAQVKQSIHRVYSPNRRFQLADRTMAWVPTTESVARQSQRGVMENLGKLSPAISSTASPAELANWQRAWDALAKPAVSEEGSRTLVGAAVLLSRPEMDVPPLPIRFPVSEHSPIRLLLTIVAIMLPAACCRDAGGQLLRQSVRWLPGFLFAMAVFAALVLFLR